jgi:hypothetical protein
MSTPPQYFIPDGSPSAPGMPFADNHEDGIYHPAGGVFGISVNGARGVEVDDDGNLKLMVADAEVLDANGDPIGGGGGASLTGWETDEDGNLVCTGTGAIQSSAEGTPIIINNPHAAPSNSNEGTWFALKSTNWGAAPFLGIDDYEGELFLLSSVPFVWRAPIDGSEVARINAGFDGDDPFLGFGVDGSFNNWKIKTGGQLVSSIAHAVTGARDESEGALASLLTILANLGLITDSTTAS